MGLTIGLGTISFSGGTRMVMCSPTYQHDGALVQNQTFTHPSNCVIAYTIVTPPDAIQDVCFRSLDANNEWRLRVAPNGALQLLRRVGGSQSTVGGASGIAAPGVRLAILLYGSTIAVYADGVQVSLKTDAVEFASATGGRVLYSTAPKMGDLKVWPIHCRGMEGVRLTEIERKLVALKNVTQEATAVRPVDVVDGLLYGADASGGNNLYVSSDYGDNWTVVQDLGAGSALTALRKLGDGEVLLGRRNVVYKSSGWADDPATATWTQVLTPNTDAWFLPFGLDVLDNIVLIAEYALPRPASRYAYVSTDYGETFETVLDLATMWPGKDDETHWHSVCIDPWSNNRLWVAHGDETSSIHYSDDLGGTWTMLPQDWQPTVMTAGQRGIVCGTDETPAGLLRITRNVQPVVESNAPLGISPPASWYGFATRGYRDPGTNLVYVSFQTGAADMPAHIMVSDGRDGHSILSIPPSTPGTLADFEQVMTIGDRLIAHLDDNGTHYLVRGDLS